MVVPYSVAGGADEAAHLRFSVARHARHRLVEEQQARLGDQRAGKLDALLQAVGQRADEAVRDAIELEEARSRRRRLAGERLLAPRARQCRQRWRRSRRGAVR